MPGSTDGLFEEIYDEANNDETLKARTEETRQKLVNFLKDWQEEIGEIVNDPTNKDKDKDEQEAIKKLNNVFKILETAIKADSKKIKNYKELLERVKQWVSGDIDEIVRIQELIKEWEEAKESQYQDQKQDRYNAIDNIKNAIARHLGAWKTKLTPLLPKDKDTLIEVAKADLINWEKNFVNETNEEAERVKQTLANEDDEAQKKKFKGIIKNLNEIVSRTENAVRSDKLSVHKKNLDGTKKIIEKVLEREIDPDEDNHYNKGLALFKEWEKYLIGDQQPSDEQKNAEKYVRLIELGLKNDNLPNYKTFVEKVEEIEKDKEEIQPFKTCPEGFNCEYHTDGNWLEAWEKLLKELKALDAEREKEKKEQDTPPCSCLHCSHALGRWTWEKCPYYQTSIYAEENKLPLIGGADGDHWTPPDFWTPFWTGMGRPDTQLIDKQRRQFKIKGVDWKWTHPYRAFDKKKKPNEELPTEGSIGDTLDKYFNDSKISKPQFDYMTQFINKESRFATVETVNARYQELQRQHG